MLHRSDFVGLEQRKSSSHFVILADPLEFALVDGTKFILQHFHIYGNLCKHVCKLSKNLNNGALPIAIRPNLAFME